MRIDHHENTTQGVRYSKHNFDRFGIQNSLNIWLGGEVGIDLLVLALCGGSGPVQAMGRCFA